MEIKKALTFRASSIGDCLMGKYLLEHIHAQFPRARLGVVVATRGAMMRDLLAAYPWLEVIEANRRSPRALFSLLTDFYGSDLIVTQYAGKPGGKFSFASKLAARFLAKRGGLIGFTDASPWNRFLYDQLLPVRPDRAVAEHDRAALRAAGIPLALPFPTLQCVENPSMQKKFNLEEGKYVVVHLFAGNAKRGLHPDKKRELLAALAHELPDVRLVMSGGGSDRKEALRAAEGLPVQVVAGEATLQEMMQLIRESRAVVSVDTGMAHIAAQLRKSLIVMRTCVAPNWWVPEQYGKDAPVSVFSSDTVCADGHISKDYPACIGAIDMQGVASRVAAAVQ